jgi:hypothetical protein
VVGFSGLALPLVVEGALEPEESSEFKGKRAQRIEPIVKAFLLRGSELGHTEIKNYNSYDGAGNYFRH